MKGAIVCFVITGIVALFMAWLLVDWLFCRIERAREQRDLRVRDAQMKRFGMRDLRGTKDQWLS